MRLINKSDTNLTQSKEYTNYQPLWLSHSLDLERPRSKQTSFKLLFNRLNFFNNPLFYIVNNEIEIVDDQF